jgi:hypothetical protein
MESQIQFNDMPPESREMIWLKTIPRCRILKITYIVDNASLWDREYFKANTKSLKALQTCSESRFYAEKHLSLSPKRLFSCQVPVDFTRDIMMFEHDNDRLERGQVYTVLEKFLGHFKDICHIHEVKLPHIRQIAIDMSHPKNKKWFPAEFVNGNVPEDRELSYTTVYRMLCAEVKIPTIELIYVVCPDGVDPSPKQKEINNIVYNLLILDRNYHGSWVVRRMGLDSETTPRFKVITKKEFFSLESTPLG